VQHDACDIKRDCCYILYPAHLISLEQGCFHYICVERCDELPSSPHSRGMYLSSPTFLPSPFLADLIPLFYVCVVCSRNAMCIPALLMARGKILADPTSLFYNVDGLLCGSDISSAKRLNLQEMRDHYHHHLLLLLCDRCQVLCRCVSPCADGDTIRSLLLPNNTTGDTLRSPKLPCSHARYHSPEYEEE
jgi:hypothetical protein